MKAMITRREFTKTLGGVAALVTLSPVSSWANGEARVSAAAGKLYRESCILDGNVLASIGSLLDKVDQKDVKKAVRESRITAIKNTLARPTGNFEQAVNDIAAADQLMEKRGELFLKVRTHGDF